MKPSQREAIARGTTERFESSTKIRINFDIVSPRWLRIAVGGRWRRMEHVEGMRSENDHYGHDCLFCGDERESADDAESIRGECDTGEREESGGARGGGGGKKSLECGRGDRGYKRQSGVLRKDGQHTTGERECGH